MKKILMFQERGGRGSPGGAPGWRDNEKKKKNEKKKNEKKSKNEEKMEKRKIGREPLTPIRKCGGLRSQSFGCVNGGCVSRCQ